VDKSEKESMTDDNNSEETEEVVEV